MIRDFVIISCAALLVTALTCRAATADSQSVRLYPGISLSQHRLAQEAMHEFFSGYWDTAEAECIQMQVLEQKDNRLPLSYLLRFAMRAWRILNSEYDNEQVKHELLREIQPIRSEGIKLLHKKYYPDSTLPTRLFIEGGLDGFSAALVIRSNPILALLNGHKAVKMLETARKLAPYLDDSYFGLGLFQCALAEEPGLVKVAVKILNGYRVNLNKGLAQLRICAGGAYYTRVGAKEYLIQFLSPFDKAQAAEKQDVFRSLESTYPESPYYVFQEIDEGFSFHRENVFSPSMVLWALSKIQQCDTGNESSRQFVNLIKWQCLTIDSTRNGSLRPAPFTAEQAYSFYPEFLHAARLRYLIDSGRSLSPDQRAALTTEYHHARKRTVALLSKSAINPMLREYFLWHVEDGLPQ